MKENPAIEKLFNIIRREDAVLWAGAGMSFSAGFPSGYSLKNHIYKALTKEQKSLVDKHLSLPDIAEEFERINSRIHLISIIETEFKNIKKHYSDMHSLLGKIFHFDSIITTNYDSLIELGYGFKCQVIRPKDPISIINPKQIQVYKLHGDFEDPENIIITTSDYNKFFQFRNEDLGIWTVVRSKMYTKNMLFVGYNLEDPNISVLFDRIVDQLGDHIRESFFIAPNLKEHKIRSLKSRGVTYIDLTGEEFFQKLTENLNLNLWKDVESGICSIDTFSKTASSKMIAFGINKNNNKFKIDYLKGINDQVRTNLNMVFPKEGSIAKQLELLISGKSLKPITLDANHFDKLELKVGDLYWGTGIDFGSLILKRNANHETIGDFIFEDDWEFNDVPLKIYTGKKYSNLELKFKSATVTLQFLGEGGGFLKTEFSYKHDPICMRVTDEIKLYTFLKRFSGGQNFTLSFDNTTHHNLSLGKVQDFYEHSCDILNYFEKLRIIEKYYAVKFPNIETRDINDETENKINQVISFVEQIPTVNEEWSGELSFNISLSKRTIQSFKKEIESHERILGCENHVSMVNIHETELETGYAYCIIDNPEVFSIFKKGNSWQIAVKSGSARLKNGYSKENLGLGYLS